MGRKKLTLSVEERLTKRAKAIAEARGTSVSRLVETFFTTLEDREEGPPKDEEGRPKARGAEESSPLDDYAPSDWASRWRGAFAKEGRTYPDDTGWEEEILVEEIREKHS